MIVNKYSLKLNRDRSNCLVNEKAYKYVDQKVDSPEHIVNLMNELFSLSEMAEEYVYVIAYNNNLDVIGVFEITHGLVNQSLLSPREIIIRLAMLNTTSFALIHNHPSGKTDPSENDMMLTKRIAEAGDICGFDMIEHVIIGHGDNNYFSFCDNDLI